MYLDYLDMMVAVWSLLVAKGYLALVKARWTIAG